MTYVKYIPSGFFGMLFDWHDQGTMRIRLFSPQPNVQRMLWFRQFFQKQDDVCFELKPNSRVTYTEVDFTVPEVIENDWEDVPPCQRAVKRKKSQHTTGSDHSLFHSNVSSSIRSWLKVGL